MLKLIEKHWPWVSILLMVAVVGSLFFLPAITPAMSLTVMMTGLCVIVVLTIQQNLVAYRKKRVDKGTLIRKISVDLSGLLLAMVVAILAGGLAGKWAGEAAAKAVESLLSGWGMGAGIFVGVLAGMMAGFLASLLVRWGWGGLKRWRSSSREK